MNNKKLFVIGGVAVAVIIAGALSVYAAWPSILFRTSPEKYVNYAIGNTMKDITIFDNSNISSEIYKKVLSESSSYDFEFMLNNIEISGFNGTEILAGLGADASLVVDRELENAGLDLRLKKSTTPVMTAKGFVSNNDFGGIVPELYDKYIVADTKDFAYNWNNSMLGDYFEIDERIDIDNMYNIIFPKYTVSNEKTISEKVFDIASTYADKLSYSGKGTVMTTYNGEMQKLTQIDITIGKEDARQFADKVIGLFDFYSADEILLQSGEYLDVDMIYDAIDQVKYYLENSNIDKDLVLELYFSKNKIVKVNTEMEVISADDMAFGVSAEIQIIDKIIDLITAFKVFVPSEGDNYLVNSDLHLVYNRNNAENNMSVDMAIDSAYDFDAVVNMECGFGFDEKNTSVYTNISKFKMDINYGEEYLSADAKLNFSCQTGKGDGVVVPDESINITKANSAEIFEIYMSVLSNLGEIAKLVNIGGIF